MEQLPLNARIYDIRVQRASIILLIPTLHYISAVMKLSISFQRTSWTRLALIYIYLPLDKQTGHLDLSLSSLFCYFMSEYIRLDVRGGVDACCGDAHDIKDSADQRTDSGGATVFVLTALTCYVYRRPP